MPTFVSTPATLWVMPTTVTAISGTFPQAEPCNAIIETSAENPLDVTCIEHVVQDLPPSTGSEQT